MKRRCAFGVCAFVAAVFAGITLGAALSDAQVAVTTWHNDQGRTGQLATGIAAIGLSLLLLVTRLAGESLSQAVSRCLLATTIRVNLSVSRPTRLRPASTP
jgi:hypothetical protein